MAPARSPWLQPQVLLQIAAYIAAFGILMAQVRANTTAIAKVTAVVERLDDRQRADELWRSGHEAYEQGESARIRDEIRRDHRDNGGGR